MNLLDPEELRRLRPAEIHAYAGPIPTQSVSSDEFMPSPQTRDQQRVEARIRGAGRRAEPPAGDDASPISGHGVRDGRGLPGHERGVRPALRREPGRGARRRRWPGTGQGARQAVRHGLPHPLPARRHADHVTLRAPARGGRQGGLEPGAGRQAADDRRPQVRELLQGGLPRQRHQGRHDLGGAVGHRAGLVPDERDEGRGPGQGQQGGGQQADAGARHLHARAAGLAGSHRPRHRRAEAGLVQGLHDRRQHQQGHQQVSVAPRRRAGRLQGVREVRQGRPGQRVHPQGPVPAVGGEAVSAPAGLLRRARRGQGRQGLAAAQLHHLSLGVPLPRRRHGGRRLGPVRADRRASSG